MVLYQELVNYDASLVWIFSLDFCLDFERSDHLNNNKRFLDRFFVGILSGILFITCEEWLRVPTKHTQFTIGLREWV